MNISKTYNIITKLLFIQKKRLRPSRYWFKKNVISTKAKTKVVGHQNNKFENYKKS